MRNHLLLFATFFLILALGALHFFAIFFYFYWTFWWFDILMHFLGGLSLGLFLMWIFHISGIFGQRAPTLRQALLTSLVSIAVIGIGWEIFEYVYNISSTEQNYILDTSIDLFADALGAFVAALWGRHPKFYEIMETNG